LTNDHKAKEFRATTRYEKVKTNKATDRQRNSRHWRWREEYLSLRKIFHAQQIEKLFVIYRLQYH
jgi:hypothetical protein